ncbi:MAG: hypothetical protein NVS2B14_08600 [Chamaesiphon sp.]
MAYSDFTLKKVKQDFSLTIVEQPSFLPEIKPIAPSPYLAQFLDKYLPLALAVNTEKARSELLICPILLEVKEVVHQTLEQPISLFSGTDFTVDPTTGLNGVCDFLLSRSPEQLFIEAPALVVVEAKREDLNAGLGQCIAEMIAVQRFNEQNQKEVSLLYGAVTTGDRWKFLQLEKQTVAIALKEYLIPPIEQILGILVHFLSSQAPN